MVMWGWFNYTHYWVKRNHGWWQVDNYVKQLNGKFIRLFSCGHWSKRRKGVFHTAQDWNKVTYQFISSSGLAILSVGLVVCKSHRKSKIWELGQVPVGLKSTNISAITKHPISCYRSFRWSSVPFNSYFLVTDNFTPLYLSYNSF